MKQKKSIRDPEARKIIKAMQDAGQFDPQRLSELVGHQMKHLSPSMTHYYTATSFGVCPNATNEKPEQFETIDNNKN